MFRKLRLKKLSNNQLKLIGLIILLLALPLILSTLYFIQDTRSRAAFPNQLETEQGVLSSSGVSKQSESGASGGQYVLFNRPGGPTPTSTPGGLGPQGTVGPRYDHYDGQPGGNFPTLGVLTSWGQGTDDIQLYSGSPISWQASNVHIVPDWVATSNDVASAMTQWLRSLPDGVSASSPTFVVFDRSQNGVNSTGYGNGTEYKLNRQIYGSDKKNFVLWGYNTKLNFTQDVAKNTAWPPGLLSYANNNVDNFHIVGFEISGPSATWMWEPSRNVDMASGPTSEMHAAAVFKGWRKLKFLDNYVHHVAGMADLREWAINAPWSYNDDAEIAWNRSYWSMNQSMLIQQGWNIHVHNNNISDSRQSGLDMEEPNLNPAPPASRNVNWTFRNNRWTNWVWQPANLNGTLMGMDSWHMAPSGQVTYENFRFLNNEFVGGYAAAGNPTYDSTLTCQPLWNAHYPVIFYLYGGQNVGVVDRVGLTIQGNVAKLDKAIVDVRHPIHCFNYTIGQIHDWRNITVTDNDFQGMSFRVRNISNLTWERNGTSQAVNY